MAAPRGGKKGRVDFIKPSDPAFLRRLKEQIGYKEPTTVDAKREALPACEPEDENDGYDERPTVVVLKTGDLTQEEANKILGIEDSEKESKGGEPAKPIFKKPEKRKATDDANDKERKSSEKAKKVSNKSLLSFDNEEDDDVDDDT